MRKVLFVSVLAGLVGGLALPLQSEPASALFSGCRKAAKVQSPGDRHTRKAFIKECKHGGGGLQTAEAAPPPEVTK